MTAKGTIISAPRRHALAVLLFGIFWATLLPPNTLAAEPNLVAGADRLQRLDDSGAVMWTIRHASVFRAIPRRGAEPNLEGIRPIVGPVAQAGHWYHATGPWLFDIDIDTGVINDRLLFPDRIRALRPTDKGLVVVLEYKPTDGDATARETFEVLYDPKVGPPARSWQLSGILLTFKDVTYLDEVISNPDGRTAQEHREAIATIQEVRRQEPDNPFYDFFLGAQHAELDANAEAESHFDRARDAARAHWTTDFQLAGMFDERGDHARADLVFERALTKVQAERPEFQKNPSLVSHAFLMGIWHQDVLPEAVKAKEFETVDRLESRIARLFPTLEGGSAAWALLAEWYDENDQPALSHKWERAAENARGPMPDIQELARVADIGLLVCIGFSLSLWFVTFLAGLRATGTRRWLRMPRLVDLGAIAIAAIVPLLALAFSLNMVNQVSVRTSMPQEAESGGLGSPNADAWLESLPSSASRDRLLEHSKHVREAYAAGADPPTLGNAQELLQESIEAQSMTLTLENLTTGRLSASWNEDNIMRSLQRLMVPWWLALALWFFVGVFVSDRLPRLSRGIAVAVPGASPSAGALSSVAVGLFVAALLALAGLDRGLIESVAAGAFYKYYGLAPIAPTEFSTSRSWAWLTLAGVLLFHLATVLVDRKREQKTDEKPAA